MPSGSPNHSKNHSYQIIKLTIRSDQSQYAHFISASLFLSFSPSLFLVEYLFKCIHLLFGIHISETSTTSGADFHFVDWKQGRLKEPLIEDNNSRV